MKEYSPQVKEKSDFWIIILYPFKYLKWRRDFNKIISQGGTQIESFRWRIENLSSISHKDK